MKKEMLDILACPVDKAYPLELHELRTEGDIVIDGVLFCSKCSRFYPVIEEIPVMLPDELRKKEEDLDFLRRWKEKIPAKMANAKPWNLE